MRDGRQANKNKPPASCFAPRPTPAMPAWRGRRVCGEYEYQIYSDGQINIPIACTSSFCSISEHYFDIRYNPY
jgi:hypothetical protein